MSASTRRCARPATRPRVSFTTWAWQRRRRRSKRPRVAHAPHANDGELALLAEAGPRICACPTTEATLGDGFLPVERLLERGIGICIGSDSNARIDPLEELREVEGIARRASLRR